MDLGIFGRRAIVCAASKGLGKACATALAAAGTSVVITARGVEALEKTAADIREKTGSKVEAIVADMATAEGRAALLAACPDPDILVTNVGGPPTGNFRDWDRAAWLKAIDTNMLGPIDLIKATVDGMIARRFGRIVNITSGSVKAPVSHLGLSNGARGGLTGFVAGVARETVRHNVTINNLLPGAFATDRLEETYQQVAKKRGVTVKEAQAERLATIPAGRFGTPAEFGAFCAFLCSDAAGYITGQNMLIDGGAYPGTF